LLRQPITSTTLAFTLLLWQLLSFRLWPRCVLFPPLVLVALLPVGLAGALLPLAGCASTMPGLLIKLTSVSPPVPGRETPTAAAGTAAAIRFPHLLHLSSVPSGQALWWEVLGGHRGE